MELLPTTRRGRVTLSLLLLFPIAYLLFLLYCVSMPGSSYTGELLPLSAGERAARERMRDHVRHLAAEIITRDLDHPESLEEAADYLREVWREQGYEVKQQAVPVGGQTAYNLEVELAGSESPEEIFIVGAHYDSAHGMPGADDNASGVAALLELSGALAPTSSGFRPRRTLRFVAFVNEEPPYFQTEFMGSLVYAKRSAERGEKLAGMLALESLGYYETEVGSQRYPFPLGLFYSNTGDFVAVVGDLNSRSFIRDLLRSFRELAAFPSEGIAAPTIIPGVGWSDHWSFSQLGFPAAMVTDTAPYRNPHYHTHGDRLHTLDFDSLTRVVIGLEAVLRALCTED